LAGLLVDDAGECGLPGVGIPGDDFVVITCGDDLRVSEGEENYTKPDLSTSRPQASPSEWEYMRVF
jgi:hypothetical protein